MKHSTKIEGYELKELAEKIGDLRYDVLAEFLTELGKKFHRDGREDLNKGRKRLALFLSYVRDDMNSAATSVKHMSHMKSKKGEEDAKETRDP